MGEKRSTRTLYSSSNKELVEALYAYLKGEFCLCDNYKTEVVKSAEKVWRTNKWEEPPRYSIEIDKQAEYYSTTMRKIETDITAWTRGWEAHRHHVIETEGKAAMERA
jgi:hypothetical protein